MDKEKILIVEDETIVALEIKNIIKKLGYTVTDIVSNYEDALQSIANERPNLVFMDINLANSKSGIEIALEIKKTMYIQIIYLTAFSDEETMQKAIDTNPSNYLLKPFKREEIKSAILLSMYKDKTEYKVPFEKDLESLGSDHYYDFSNDNFFYKDQAIYLSSNEKKFLRLLIRANGQVVPFLELEEYIWQAKNLSKSTFRTLVYRLRGKIKYDFIESVPSFGYRLKIEDQL